MAKRRADAQRWADRELSGWRISLTMKATNICRSGKDRQVRSIRNSEKKLLNMVLRKSSKTKGKPDTLAGLVYSSFLCLRKSTKYDMMGANSSEYGGFI